MGFAVPACGARRPRRCARATCAPPRDGAVGSAGLVDPDRGRPRAGGGGGGGRHRQPPRRCRRAVRNVPGGGRARRPGQRPRCSGPNSASPRACARLRRLTRPRHVQLDGLLQSGAALLQEGRVDAALRALDAVLARAPAAGPGRPVSRSPAAMRAMLTKLSALSVQHALRAHQAGDSTSEAASAHPRRRLQPDQLPPSLTPAPPSRTLAALVQCRPRVADPVLLCGRAPALPAGAAPARFAAAPFWLEWPRQWEEGRGPVRRAAGCTDALAATAVGCAWPAAAPARPKRWRSRWSGQGCSIS